MKRPSPPRSPRARSQRGAIPHSIDRHHASLRPRVDVRADLRRAVAAGSPPLAGAVVAARNPRRSMPPSTEAWRTRHRSSRAVSVAFAPPCRRGEAAGSRGGSTTSARKRTSTGAPSRSRWYNGGRARETTYGRDEFGPYARARESYETDGRGRRRADRQPVVVVEPHVGVRDRLFGVGASTRRMGNGRGDEYTAGRRATRTRCSTRAVERRRRRRRSFCRAHQALFKFCSPSSRRRSSPSSSDDVRGERRRDDEREEDSAEGGGETGLGDNDDDEDDVGDDDGTRETLGEFEGRPASTGDRPVRTRVNSLSTGLTRSSKKPSMTNCPAYVPVMVEL